jgi:hypothetical protein
MKVLGAVVWLAKPSGENIGRATCILNGDLVVKWLRFGNRSVNINLFVYTLMKML